jgi:hypothetical protein
MMLQMQISYMSITTSNTKHKFNLVEDTIAYHERAKLLKDKALILISNSNFKITVGVINLVVKMAFIWTIGDYKEK